MPGWWQTWLMIVALALAGCAEDADTDDGASAGEPILIEQATAADWGDQDRLLIAQRQSDVTAFETDVLCTFGGGVELRRDGQRILPGSADLAIAIDVPAVYTGYQVGYQLDGGAVEWTPTAPPGAITTFVVPVAEDQTEPDRARWTFHMRGNLFVAEQECYTGGGQGPLAITVEAVRGPIGAQDKS